MARLLSSPRLRSSSVASLAVLFVLLGAGSALGQTAINQAKANNGLGGCDAPGFPVTICKPGSYKLTGNLTVPNSNTTAIVIAASQVTLDLNGFAILGPTDCTGGLDPCAHAGSGHGITTSGVQFNITIRNGAIHGMGSIGINLIGDSHVVEHVRVRNNGHHGISIEPSVDDGSSVVQHSVVQRNGGVGIVLFLGSARHNTVDVNSAGIVMIGGSVSHNVVSRNVAHGLSLGLGSQPGYLGNVLRDNGANVAGGVNLGHNLCNVAVCP